MEEERKADLEFLPAISPHNKNKGKLDIKNLVRNDKNYHILLPFFETRQFHVLVALTIKTKQEDYDHSTYSIERLLRKYRYHRFTIKNDLKNFQMLRIVKNKKEHGRTYYMLEEEYFRIFSNYIKLIKFS
jgi:hypothetical protein